MGKRAVGSCSSSIHPSGCVQTNLGEKLVWQHHCRAWCLCLPAELEASGRACVHEQTRKQKGVTRNPEGCLCASKADGARVRSAVQTNFFLNSKVSCPEKTLVSSDGHKGTEGACWKQGGGVLSIGDPEAAGCREGLWAPLVSRKGFPQQTEGSSQVHVSTHKDLLPLCTNYLL